MSDGGSLDADFAALWETHGLADRTLTLNSTQTMVPSQRLLEGDRRATLPRVLSTHENGSQLEIVREIGKGGMGVVHLARQIALRREVAIKQLRDDRRSERHAAELLREGLLVGALEHPNIVPVYMLGADDDGFPTIVMKRIEGRNWGEELLSPDEAESAHDRLQRNLDILMQVCNAVHFAHSRDIVHRDLKPDNVMVGAFGEVYVLDWGIAVSLSESETMFPRASDANEVAGTPAYMAPEQVIGDGTLMTPRTDVYLLGAILHQVLTGDVPHSGNSMFEIMQDAYLGAPRQYPGVPVELARICQRAMATRPEDRFATADDLRRALATFLRHRESATLAADGHGAMDALREAVERKDSTACDEAFARGRFAYDAALATWAESPEALGGRAELFAQMLDWEIASGDARGARRLASELGDVDDEVLRSIEALEERRASQQDKAAQMEQILADADLAQHAQWRAIMLYCIAVGWLVSLYIYDSFGPLSHVDMATAGLSTLGLGVVVALVGRHRFVANRVNRQFLAGYGVCVAAMVLAHVCVDHTSFPAYAAAMMDCLVFAAVGMVMAFTIDRRFVGAAAIHVSGLLWLTFYPQHGYTPMAVTCALGEAFLGTTAVLDWGRGRHAASYLLM